MEKLLMPLALMAILLTGCSKSEYVNHCKGCLAKGLARCVHCDQKGWDTCHCGGSGEKAAMEQDISGIDFTADFVEHPHVGDVILKVQTQDPRKAALRVFVHYDMPSMRGAHDTTRQMKLNKKGDFVIPVSFAMAGDWEIVVTVKDEKDAVVGQKVIRLDI